MFKPLVWRKYKVFPLFEHHSMKAYGTVIVRLQTFLISALRVGDWVA